MDDTSAFTVTRRTPIGGRGAMSWEMSWACQKIPGVTVWQCGKRVQVVFDWIRDLIREGYGVSIGSRGGMPWRIAVQAKHVEGRLGNQARGAREFWLHEIGDVLAPGYEGKSSTDEAVKAALDPEEWLFVEAWDES